MDDKMTPMEAWHIISANLMELYKLKRTDTYKGYTDADVTAEVICFGALKNLEKDYERGVDNG
jgi:hypothetical protein